MSDEQSPDDASWLETLASPVWKTVIPTAAAAEDSTQHPVVYDVTRDVRRALGLAGGEQDVESLYDCVALQVDAGRLLIDLGSRHSRSEVVVTAHFTDPIRDEQIVIALDDAGRGEVAHEAIAHLDDAGGWTLVAIPKEIAVVDRPAGPAVISISSDQRKQRRPGIVRTAFLLAAAAVVVILLRGIPRRPQEIEITTTPALDSPARRQRPDSVDPNFGLADPDSIGRDAALSAAERVQRDVAFYVPRGASVSGVLARAAADTSFACGLEDAIARERLEPDDRRTLRRRLTPNDTLVHAASDTTTAPFPDVESALLFQLHSLCGAGLRKRQ